MSAPGSHTPQRLRLPWVGVEYFVGTEQPKNDRASEAAGVEAAAVDAVALEFAEEVLRASLGLKGSEREAQARYRDALERATEYREVAAAVLDHLAH